MRERVWRTATLMLLLTVVVAGCGAATVAAETFSSPNYKVTGPEFNAVSNTENCSGQYCARVSMGDMTAGDGKTPESSARFGTTVDSDEPLLEVIVDPGESHLGVLSTEQTATKTSTLRIRNHLSDGYTVQIVGKAPKYGNHTIATPTTPTSPQAGTEQFGINAVENTSPDVGANPILLPSNQINLGLVNANYRTANKFMYVDGDEIARSEAESGRTDYTISMMVNISNKTPAGHYSGDFSAVVTPIY